MKNSLSRQNRTESIATRKHASLLPLVAVGGTLAALPASALELGEISVQSRLGQPLRASIAYALAPNEELADYCISLGAARAANGLPGVGRATLSVADGVILLTGKAPIREPMIAANVTVNCPYTARLSRDYMLFLDPVGSGTDAEPAVASAPAAAAPVRQAPETVTRRAVSQTPVEREPIGKSTRYRVQPGDSLSQIAARIENRPVRLWPAVNAIFDANPHAFMDDDPNKLKAGSWLTIPSFDGGEPVITSAAETEVARTAAEAIQPAAPAATLPAETPDLSAPQVSEIPESAVFDTSGADSTLDLQPGDIILQDGSTASDAGVAASERVIIPDTAIDAPATRSSSPNVTTAVISTGTQQSSSSWLLWLAGAGIAIIVALLMFGRRVRERFGGEPLAPAAEHPLRRATDGDTENIEALVDDDYDLDDDSPTAENLALDADLVMGTGLAEGTGMDVAEDFGFAAPTEVDIELPFEPEASAATIDTEILSPGVTDEQTILESEILPDYDDYDMSVVMDATKMPHPEDVTERDFRAVEVEPADDSLNSGTYTINEEADLELLQKDYEDELTATQKLNEEIARAATELAATLKERDERSEEVTTELPLATVTELDVTAQLRPKDRRGGDPDPTAVTEAGSDDKTAEMPKPEKDDDTAEMEIEGGTVDTRAS